jgi:phosphate starvation-inducible protein PhoH
MKGTDVIRHRLVKEIIRAYAAHSGHEQEPGEA